MLFPVTITRLVHAQTSSHKKCTRIEHMLSDLEYTYSPVRDRVRDLREYL
jgi:hypothetical protein